MHFLSNKNRGERRVDKGINEGVAIYARVWVKVKTERLEAIGLELEFENRGEKLKLPNCGETTCPNVMFIFFNKVSKKRLYFTRFLK